MLMGHMCPIKSPLSAVRVKVVEVGHIGVQVKMPSDFLALSTFKHTDLNVKISEVASYL